MNVRRAHVFQCGSSLQAPAGAKRRALGMKRHLAVVSAGSKDNQVDQLPLVPASTAVPTAAAKQQNEKYNDEKRGGIHVRFPRNAAYCAAWNSDFFDNV